jgi:hypothetical protein
VGYCRVVPAGTWADNVIANRNQLYEDKPVTPGQYYEYKVKAAKSESNFSNSAVVYGAP